MDTQIDRVRRRTAVDVLRRIDDDTLASVGRCADAPPEEIDARLAVLDREWDTDRALEVEAAATGLLGLALATFAGTRFLALPAFVAASVLLHATTGRYPLMPVFRRMGLRTAREIARERYALKALRGDFAVLDARSAELAAPTDVRGTVHGAGSGAGPSDPDRGASDHADR
jgi:hypothetical protein